MYRYIIILILIAIFARNFDVISKIDKGISTTDVLEIEANIIDAPITIIESDVQEVTVSSTVVNTGLGFITQPSTWKKDGVLYFHQGYAVGWNTESTGDITIEIPEGMVLDIDIKSGSGDVFVNTSVSTNISIDAAVGEKIIESNGKNLFIKSVSGNITIGGIFANTEIDTINSNLKMYANADTDKIYYESISGNATIFMQRVRGYNLLHTYAGGKTEEYCSVEESLEKIVEVSGDTIDGHINIVHVEMDGENLLKKGIE